MLPVSTEKLHEIYNSCGGRVCTDTRKIDAGSLFFCLKGANFDGNQFAAEALKSGAAYVVADDPNVITDSRILWVNDTLQALQELATFHRKKLKDTRFLAIGGSNGKTTTKELCARVIGTFKRCKATEGNLNNHIGVPLTLLSVTRDTDVAIIEMGTNHPGEMKVLCDITLPDMGIVTNVGKEHLEGFGDLETVAREESELYLQLMSAGGLALVNADDPWLGNMARRLSNRISYGVQTDADLTAVVSQSMPILKFSASWKGQELGTFRAALGGDYNMHNILAAVAAGIALGGDPESCFSAACSYSPGNNRSEWRDTGHHHVWLDAYNANPSSVEAALRSFATISGTKAVMLGDMLELGAHAAAEHQAIFSLCRELGFNEIYLVGPEFRKAAGQYPFVYENCAMLNAWLRENSCRSEYILVKGSRGIRMEQVLEVLA